MFQVQENEIFTVRELADRMDICYNTVQSFIAKGLKAKKIGGQTYIAGINVLQFFREDAYDRPEPEDTNSKLAKKLAKVL